MKTKELRKKEKLQHYETRDLTKFYQYDGWTDFEMEDLLPSDGDGDCICGGDTEELMSGAYKVRVLITNKGKKEDVVRCLKKILRDIEKSIPSVLDVPDPAGIGTIRTSIN